MKRNLVTIGTFDGVHRGHQKLMRWVIRLAESQDLRTKVVLFDAPPRFYFRPDLAVPLLTTSAERKRLIRALGVDSVEILRFGPRWANMPHTRFFEEYIVRRWRAGGVLVGRDFAFGKGRKGDIRFLESACKDNGMAAGVLPLLRVGSSKISSSRIRDLLQNGEARAAARLLGRPHAVSGRVVRGRGLGRTIGIPTANVDYPPELLVPRGVYHARVFGPGFEKGREAVCNVGFRPTVAGKPAVSPLLEVHIPGFSGDLYGARLRVEFLRRIRSERRFPSLEALKRRIRLDIRAIRRPVRKVS